MPLNIIAFALCLIVAAAPAWAKGKKSEKAADPQAIMDAYKELATPGEPHKQLATLEGTWATTTKEWMDPSRPPTESTGTCDEKMVIEGRYLQQACTSEMMGQPYTGMGVIGYDKATKKYVSTWIDSMSTGIFVMSGTASADGKTITLYGGHKDPFEGLLKHRAVWKLVDENTQTFQMYVTRSQGKETKILEITYTRTSPTQPATP